MESLIGIRGNDFVLLASDTVSARSIVKMVNDCDKMVQVTNNLVMAVAGEAGDTEQFSEFIAKNMQLYKMRNGYELSAKATAHFTRRNLAEALRTQRPKLLSLLMGGVDEEGPALFYLDHVGSMVEVPFAAHGYGGLFSLTLLDRHYKKNLTRDGAMALLKMCIKEIQVRFLVDMPQLKVKVVSSQGVEDLGFVTAVA